MENTCTSKFVSILQVRMLFLMITCLSAWTISAQQIGVNYNGQFDHVNFDDLSRTNTTWVRGFIDFFVFYDDPSKLDTDPRIQKYLELKDNGYSTILNIKFDYRGKAFPAVDSPEMNNIKAFLAQLYDKVWDGTDIIVVGNEPFIESRSQDRTANGPLVKFYRQMCIKTKNYRTGKKNVPIYVGSFDNLYLSSKRIQAVDDLLAFAHNHSWMAGIDLHIHHSGINQINSAINYVNNKIRSNQKILITEYSLMKHWRNYMDNTINGAFAATWNRNSNWKNYQYIDYALKNQVSRPEWVDYFTMHSWYNNRARYIKNSYDRFKTYSKFHIATYAIRQSYPFNQDFTTNTDPWVLNPLFVNRTVELNPNNGKFQFNYSFIDDFRGIQNGTISRLAEEQEISRPLAAELAVYPNPAVDHLHILNKPANSKVFLWDMQGKLWQNTSENSINLEALPTGLYMVGFSGSGEKLKVFKK